jgi:hypothetical protein
MDQINADPKGNWDNLAQKKLVNKLYVEESVKVQVGQVEMRNEKVGRGLQEVCCL